MSNQSVGCDIIIPTYNNASVITRTLRALFQQKVPAELPWRLIISDDGSTDDTVAVIQKVQAESPWPLRVLNNPHRGAASARNQGLAVSESPFILFLGADILLQPGALAAHANFHHEHPAHHVAALGHVTWDPLISPSPFMAWLIHGGPQNDFDALLGQTAADPRHYFYGSHLSLKKEMLNHARWQTKFGAYGWEDLDLGRRLAEKGLILKTLFVARGLHHHAYSVNDMCRRQRAAGASLNIYQQLHPAVPLLPLITWRSRVKLWLLCGSGLAVALKTLLRYSGKRWTTPRLFFLLTTVEYWRGIISAQER